MGVAVSGMHYTGMAALQLHSVSGQATQGGASAVAFLLPLILGIGIVTFILTAVIALAPTAAEIVEEADLMSRIGRPQYQESDPYPPRDDARLSAGPLLGTGEPVPRAPVAPQARGRVTQA